MNTLEVCAIIYIALNIAMFAWRIRVDCIMTDFKLKDDFFEAERLIWTRRFETADKNFEHLRGLYMKEIEKNKEASLGETEGK